MEVIRHSHAFNNATTIQIGPAGSGRRVVALASQNRTPPSISGVTLNGVNGSFTDWIYHNNVIVRLVTWLDDELPASAGTYNVARTGSGSNYALTVFYLENAPQTNDGIRIVKDVRDDANNLAIPFVFDDVNLGSFAVSTAHAVNNASTSTSVAERVYTWQYGGIVSYAIADSSTVDVSLNVNVYSALHHIGYMGVLFPETEPVEPLDPRFDDIEDTSVSQYTEREYQLLDWREEVTDGSFGGRPVTILSSDVVNGGAVSVLFPGDLSSGTYNLILNGSDGTTSSVDLDYAVTHPIRLPIPGQYDENSLFANVGTSFPVGTYANIPTTFTGPDSQMTIEFVTGSGWADVDLTAAVDTIIRPPAGVYGTFTTTGQAIFPDGTVDDFTLSFTVDEPASSLTINISLHDENGQAVDSVSVDWFAAGSFAGEVIGSGTETVDNGHMSISLNSVVTESLWLFWKSSNDATVGGCVKLATNQAEQ